jgi:hypothetical protein
MKLVVEVNCDNAAFEDYPDELARILRKLADRLDGCAPVSGKLRDTHGNTVGRFELSEET